MFTADRQVFTQTLDKVSRVIDNSPLNSSLENVLLRLDGGVLEMVGSDGQVQVSAQCEVKLKAGKGKKAANPAALALKARKLNGVLRSLASPDITLTLDGSNCKLTSGSSRFVLELRNPDEYPLMALDGQQSLKLELPQKDFLEIIKRLQAAISAQAHRLYLAGALFDFRDKELHLVATDGHRLVTDVLPVAGEDGDSFILPRKAVLELTRLLDPEGKEAVALSATKDDEAYRTVEFQLGESKLTSQLIAGQYPAYARVIPTEETNNQHIKFNRMAMIDGVRQVSSIHDKVGDTVKFIAKGGEAAFEIVAEGTSSQDSARAELTLAEEASSGLESSVNSTYMIEMLQAFEGCEKIDLAFKDGLASLLFRPAEDKDSRLQYVVMPVR